jgi:hypothetical protein
MQKEVNLTNLHQKEEEIEKLFHIKIHVKNTKADALFGFGSCANLIEANLDKDIGLEVHDHPTPYPLGWVNKDANARS